MKKTRAAASESRILESAVKRVIDYKRFTMYSKISHAKSGGPGHLSCYDRYTHTQSKR